MHDDTDRITEQIRDRLVGLEGEENSKATREEVLEKLTPKPFEGYDVKVEESDEGHTRMLPPL